MNLRSFSLTCSFFFAAAISSLADYPAVVNADGPLAYYRFEEAAGATTIADSSGNGLDADYSAPIGTTQLGEDGAVGLAALFNGDDGILTPLTLNPALGDFTIEAIINPTAIPAAGGVFISNQDGAGGLGRSNLLVQQVDGGINAYIGGATTTSGVNAEIGNWYHVILTYDSSAAGGGVDPTIRFYVDGVEQGNSMILAEAADGGWVIGSHKSQASQFFSGLVDEVAIYDKRLDDPDGDGDTSDSRVDAHFQEYLADSVVLISFESDVEFVDAGGTANLSWTVSPALTALTLSDGVNAPVDVLGDLVDGAGGMAVMPTTTTTYTLEGTSPIGTESIEVTVSANLPAVIDSFTSAASEVVAGSSVDLSWSISNAATAEIDNGVGVIDPISGTVSVVVNADTTYTLTATNALGSVTEMVTVTTRPGDPNLIAHWRVGEAAGETDGTELISETGAGFLGTFVGNPTFDTGDPAPVPSGSTASIVFDGFDSYVDVLGYGGIGGSAARTVAFWYKGSASQQNNNATLVGWGAGSPNGARFDTRKKNDPSGFIRTEVAGSGTDGTAIMADDTWHHCAAVFDPTIGTTIGDIVFYIDGELDTISAAGGTPVNTSTANNVRIGESRALTGRSLTGKMDDIRIYDRALNAGEVLALVESSTEFKIESVRALENGFVEINWSADPGDYAVQYSFDLKNWSELDDPSIPAGENSLTTIDSFIAPQTENVRVYYRVVAN